MSGCPSGKERYETKGDARRALALTKQHGRHRKGRKREGNVAPFHQLEVYRCEKTRCGGWHLGHRKTVQTRKGKVF